ncbi:molybdate ABC transporter substrate-binding protein [Sulfitobacter aestuarii]|uniref:Molybdate ABC transporter substrate-binding protein n=1 Tax=Sulfitobacter aestuarii TaxID=2161676 RepID=A0ABW5U2T9_9RHOB
MRHFLCRAMLFGGAMIGALSLAAPLAAGQITVFAAASLATALEEIEAGFEAQQGHDLVVSLAGSSMLARQIEHGAPADVFISANSDWMDRLAAEGLIAERTRFDLLGNEIVLIARGGTARRVALDATLDLGELLNGGRLAMALVDAVPAGIYGKAALERLGLWDDIADRVAQTDNVRAALALVATGEAPLGIVYATDARAAPEVSVIGRFPAGNHPPIVYPAAALARRDTPETRAFLDYLRGPQARAAFEAQGFTMATR